MKVSDLKAGQGKVDVEVTVKSMENPRTFNKYGKDLKVVNAMVHDDSGNIKMSLWNDDVDKIKVGDKVKVTNGYVSEFNGEKQLTSGKFGKLEIVGNGKATHSGDKGEKSEKNDKNPKKEIKSDDYSMDEEEDEADDEDELAF